MKQQIIETLDWEREGSDWPNRDCSRFVNAAGLRWHVQESGEGPVAFLLHGSGASTHSWRDLAPRLSQSFRVLAVDLPGHGFSEKGAPRELSMEGVSRALQGLLYQLDVQPSIVLGHSAGAALACWMTLQGLLAPAGIVSLNGAHLPLRGYPSWLYGPIAGLISNSRVLPRLFAGRASNRAVVERLLTRTGSELDPAGFDFYWRLARTPAHVSASLGLMANWDLRQLDRGIHQLDTPLLLITGEDDGTVPPSDSRRVAERVKGARFVSLPGLGHLAHEEDPRTHADLIERFWADLQPRQQTTA